MIKCKSANLLRGTTRRNDTHMPYRGIVTIMLIIITIIVIIVAIITIITIIINIIVIVVVVAIIIGIILYTLATIVNSVFMISMSAHISTTMPEKTGEKYWNSSRLSVTQITERIITMNNWDVHLKSYWPFTDSNQPCLCGMEFCTVLYYTLIWQFLVIRDVNM